MPYDFENSEGWDCDPFAVLELDDEPQDEPCLDRASHEWEW